MIHLCHVCGKGHLALLPEFTPLKRVTSDCKPWPAGGKLGVCEVCSTAQNIVDETWREECRQIYSSYTIYHQAGGTEQPVFDLTSGVPAARSDQFLKSLGQTISLPEKGRLLDVGCGNGGFLRSFAKSYPQWRLTGSEYDAKYKAQVESIPGVEACVVGDIVQIAGGFDIISIIHVLEHLDSPRHVLETVRGKLQEQGRLLIELPYYVENPFVLTVADHATHFDAPRTCSLLASAGFSPTHVTSAWVPKELSLVAEKGHGAAQPTELPSGDAVAAVRWLGTVRDEAMEIARTSRNFGILGTSIAATWLYAELGDRVDFFVDEDQNRTGKEMFGKPVLAPEKVPVESDIYISLPVKLAQNVRNRMKSAPGRYHMPPD
jgi:2-polyprenyl-3-methyl-5-hydroxy-6-metoxy-1,4-benzoquinol methylase